MLTSDDKAKRLRLIGNASSLKIIREKGAFLARRPDKLELRLRFEGDQLDDTALLSPGREPKTNSGLLKLVRSRSNISAAESSKLTLAPIAVKQDHLQVSANIHLQESDPTEGESQPIRLQIPLMEAATPREISQSQFSPAFKPKFTENSTQPNPHLPPPREMSYKIVEPAVHRFPHLANRFRAPILPQRSQQKEDLESVRRRVLVNTDRIMGQAELRDKTRAVHISELWGQSLSQRLFYGTNLYNMHQVKQKAKINAVRGSHRRVNSEGAEDVATLQKLLDQPETPLALSPGRQSKGSRSPGMRPRLKVDAPVSILSKNIQPASKLRLLVEHQLLKKMNRQDTSVFNSFIETQPSKIDELGTSVDGLTKHLLSENKSTVDTPGLKKPRVPIRPMLPGPGPTPSAPSKDPGTFQHQVRQGTLVFGDLHRSMKASSKLKQQKHGLDSVLKHELHFLKYYYGDSTEQST